MWLGRVAAALFALATLAALLVGLVGPDAWRTGLGEGGPACPFLALTGVPCPFCGMTRATIALGHGDLHAALGFHPLAPVVLALVLGLCGIVAFGRAHWLRPPARLAAVCGAIALVWLLRFLI